MAQAIAEVMTQDVAAVTADAALVEAARTMDDRNIGDVVVVDNGGVVGIVTDRDITVRGTARGADPRSTPVREVMSENVVTLDRGSTVDEAVQLMREKAVRRLVVVDDGSLAGVVSLGDLAVEQDRQSVLGEISDAPPNE